MASSVPKTMQAVVFEKTGKSDVLQVKEDWPVPTPEKGQLLVKNQYGGVNFIDTYHREGLYPVKFPFISGLEGEGVVVTSDSPEFKPGDRVVHYRNAGGAMASYIALDPKNAYKVPDSVPPGQACAVFLQGLTALTMITDAYHAQSGDWVLVLPAAGGTGGLMVQMLKARGVNVIALASTPEKRELAKSFGADVTASYDETEVMQIIEKHTTRPKFVGVHATYDGVGKSTFELAMKATARKGTIVSFGNASGAVEPLSILRLGEKNLKVCRPRLFGYTTDKEEAKPYLDELWHLIESGKLKVGVHKEYSIQEISQAHDDLQSRGTTGKLLVRL